MDQFIKSFNPQILHLLQPDELNSLLMFSIINRRVGFIRLLLDYGADLKNFLTAPNLTKLYNILPKNSGAFKLLTRFDRAVSALFSISINC